MTKRENRCDLAPCSVVSYFELKKSPTNTRAQRLCLPCFYAITKVADDLKKEVEMDIIESVKKRRDKNMKDRLKYRKKM